MRKQRQIHNALIDRGKCERALRHLLLKTTAKQLVRMLYSPYEAVVDFMLLCRDEKTGEKISMLFNPHRFDIKTNTDHSITAGFDKSEWFSGLARITLHLAYNSGISKSKNIVRGLLYQALGMNINGHKYVNEFPPYIARDLYKRYHAKRILDPCAGWGGRMIGASAVGSHYHAYEPSTKTYEGLLELAAFLQSFETGFSFELFNEPFEEANVPDGFDLAFTSPPYYDTEHYSKERTNSLYKFTSFKKWVAGFYLPLVKTCLQSAEHTVLNIGTRQYDLLSPLEELYPIKRLRCGLSGKGGLGKTKKGQEALYEIDAEDTEPKATGFGL